MFGGSIANSLLAAGRPVRAVMRNVGKADVCAVCASRLFFRPAEWQARDSHFPSISFDGRRCI